MKRAKYIVTPNPYTFDQLKKIGFEKRTVLLDSFLSKTKNFNIVDAKDDTILFVGTVEPRKGLNYGIQAFTKFVKDHPTYSLIIAGNIPYESYFEELKLLISDLKIEDKIVFLGRVGDVEKDKLYRNSKVFLFPSQNEGYGHVLIEAMSYGLPVIAFNNTAMPYTVNEENGFLISNKNVYEMSTALSKLIDDRTLYCKLSKGALQTINKLPSYSTIEEKYMLFFKRLKDEL